MELLKYSQEILREAIRVVRNGKIPESLFREVLRCDPSPQLTQLAMVLAREGRADQLRQILPRLILFPREGDLLIYNCFYAVFPWMKPIPLLDALSDILLNGGVQTQQKDLALDSPYAMLADRPEIFDGISKEMSFALLRKVKQLGFDPKATIYGYDINLLYLCLQGMNIPMVRFLEEEGLHLKELDEHFGVAATLFCHAPLNKGLGYHKRHREEEVWELCKDAGCDINKLNSQGQTALHQLILKPWANDSSEVVQIALRLGADPTIKDENNQTAGELARQLGLDQEIQDLLLGGEKNEEYHCFP